MATILASVVAANWLNSRFQYHWTYWRMVFSALAIFVLFKLIESTPIIGWLFMILLVCSSLGALLMNIHWRRRTDLAM